MFSAIGKATPSMIGMISFFFEKVTSEAKTLLRKRLSFIGHVAVDRGDVGMGWIVAAGTLMTGQKVLARSKPWQTT
jgi:hypothetical protein